MEQKQTKFLLGLTYYSMALVIMTLCGLFIWEVVVNPVPTYVTVIYSIWAGALILTVLFDIICTMSGSMKFWSGIMIYVLAVLCIIMAIVTYFALGLNGRIGGNEYLLYTVLMLISFSSIVMSMAIHCYGMQYYKH